MKRLVVLGGGYGGLRVIDGVLDKNLPDDVEVTLVDRMPHHGLKTEYYALAAGTEPDSVVRVPFPDHNRLQMKYGVVTDVSLNSNEITFENGETLTYDWLVIGLGCTDRYHGIPGADQFTCSIQSLTSSRKTYQQVNNVKPYGDITIVGGGLSGVEMAAELRDSRPDLNIRIVDRGPSILSPFPDKLQTYVRSWFDEHGVEMVSNAGVNRVEQGAVYNKDDIIYTDAIVWTAGIQPVEVVQKLDVEKDAGGRVVTNEWYQIPNFENTYVIGDCASSPFAASAQLAEVHGDHVAEILQAIWKNEPFPTLGKIKLKGVLGSLGKKAGFGLMGKQALVGKIPRVLKSGVLWMYKNHLG